MPIESYPPRSQVSASTISELQTRVQNIENAGSRNSLIINGDLEAWDSATDATAWSYGWANGSPVRAKETTVIMRGSSSWKTTMSTTSDLQRLGTSEFRVNPGDQVIIKFWARATNAACRLDMTYLTNDASNPAEIFATGVATTTNGGFVSFGAINTWQEFTFSYIVPAGHTRSRIYINESLSVNAAGSIFYLDSVNVFVPGPPPNALDVTWTVPTLGNSWANYDSGASFEQAAYKRVGGIVYVRGLIMNGTPSTVFTLPAGFRPYSAKIFTCWANTGTVRIDVTAGGSINVGPYTTGGSNAFVSLASIIFPADQ